jgi:hypothetical protein
VSVGTPEQNARFVDVLKEELELSATPELGL